MPNCHWEFSHSNVTLHQDHPNRLVFEETSHSGDSNICQYSNRANHGPQKHSNVSRCPHHDQVIHVWLEQVSCHKFNHNSIHTQHKAQHVDIPQRERSHCSQNLEFHWCSSDHNKSNVLSNHWEHAKVKETISKLFGYQGDITLLKPD